MPETATVSMEAAPTTGQETRKLFSIETFQPAMKADVGNEACICLCACVCV